MSEFLWDYSPVLMNRPPTEGGTPCGGSGRDPEVTYDAWVVKGWFLWHWTVEKNDPMDTGRFENGRRNDLRGVALSRRRAVAKARKYRVKFSAPPPIDRREFL